MTFDLENARAADEALPYPLDAKEIWISGKGQMHINPPNEPSIFFTLSDLCEFRNLFHGQAAEIERLRGEMENYGDDYVCQMKSKDARIAELEDALAEERAQRYSLENTGTQLSQAGNQFQKRCLRSARNQLQIGGKIGPDAKPRSWQITEERIATIAASLKVLERLKKVNTNTDNCYLDAGIAVLRTMLEASQ